MINLLIAGLAFAAVSGALNPPTWKKTSESQVLLNKNFKVTNHELTNLEKQKESILSLTEYNDEVYIGMRKDNLAKINSDDKITQVPLGELSDSNKNIELMVPTVDHLYLVNIGDKTSSLLKMSKEELKQIYESGENERISSLGMFYDLYIAVTSPTGSKLIKTKTHKDVFTEVLDLPGKTLLGLKSFGVKPNPYLCFVVADATGNIEINTLDINGEVKKITELKNQKPNLHLTEYNHELYFSLYDGSLYKIDINREVKEVVKRNLSSGPSSLVVFKDELYLGTSSKLEKLTKNNEIETVVELPEVILSLAEYYNYPDEKLYIGMENGYFAKLS